MRELRGEDRKYLRKLAHRLRPVVHIGKGGLTDNVIESVNLALYDHELIKAKFVEFKEEKRSLSEEVARRTESHRVGLIGNIAILYREHPEEEKRKIQLPSRC